MPLVPQINLQEFDKWVVDFVGPIILRGKCTCVRDIIIAIDYLTRWIEEMLVKYCTIATATEFLFENVVTRFGSLKFFINDQGTHFFNQLIEKLMEEFQIQHRNTMSYHPQANGDVKAFNKILENALKNICNVQRDDWDQKITALLWEYCMTCKKLTSRTPF